MTSAFFSIWPSAAALPLSGLEKPPSSAVWVRYWGITLTFGSVALTPCWKPASNLWVSGVSTPPTKPTTSVLVALAAAAPAREGACSSAEARGATVSPPAPGATVPEGVVGHLAAAAPLAGPDGE